MSEYTIYHNPRCSKSRQALALLEERGISPDVRLYLNEPLDRAEMTALLKRLDMKASQLVRRGEAEFKALKLTDEEHELDWLDALVDYPKLMERPIVQRGDRAVVGRPPEDVLALID